MTKVELIAAVAENAGLSKKDAEQAVNATVEAITKALAEGDKVSLVGFGTFETRERPARKGRNPRTKEEITIPATTTPAFKAGKALKDAVAKSAFWNTLPASGGLTAPAAGFFVSEERNKQCALTNI